MISLIITAIWLIDIFNCDLFINGHSLKYLLDVTVPINTTWWLVIFIIISIAKDD